MAVMAGLPSIRIDAQSDDCRGRVLQQLCSTSSLQQMVKLSAQTLFLYDLSLTDCRRLQSGGPMAHGDDQLLRRSVEDPAAAVRRCPGHPPGAGLPGETRCGVREAPAGAVFARPSRGLST